MMKITAQLILNISLKFHFVMALYGIMLGINFHLTFLK